MSKKFTDYLRSDDEAGANISWSAVFAGLVTFFAVFITLSLIGSAIGFGLLAPTSNDPVNGAATGVMIWTVIAFLLSFAAAGFVAGLTSNRVGLVHGFITWATTTLVLVVMISYTTVAAISGVTSFLGGVASTATQGAGVVASGAGKAISASVEGVTKNLDIKVDTNDLQQNLQKFLKDTDQKELQPEYLQGQLKDASGEIADAAKQILLNPGQAQEIIKKTSDDLKARAEKIGNSVDKEAISKAVSKNSNLSKEEADKATENIYEGYKKSVVEVQKGIDNASQQLTKVSEEAKKAVADARQGAENATTATSKASIWAFFAMLLGAVVTSACGLAGARVGRKPETQAKA